MFFLLNYFQSRVLAGQHFAVNIVVALKITLMDPKIHLVINEVKDIFWDFYLCRKFYVHCNLNEIFTVVDSVMYS